MTALDPRTPVVAGAGQLTQRPAQLTEALEPVAMMTEAARRAGADAGAPHLLARADLVAVVKGAWRYPDPARIVAAGLGAAHARTALSTDGGNTPQLLVDVIAERVAAGALDVAVIAGAEGIWSRRRLRDAGLARSVTRQTGVSPDEVIGRDLPMTSEHEQSRHLIQPVDVYPLFESAIRHRRGETLDGHLRRIAGLWARFNTVAVANPYAWLRQPMTAAEIATPSAGNRMVAFPYPKAMCSNWDLDQAAALIVCSAAAASGAGVPRDRWVFPIAGAEADDTALVSHRRDLGSSPAIAAAWSALRQASGLGTGDIAHVDLYSCFPSAVEAAAEAIGLDESRQLTVTGGLTFAGGPLSNYVTHSIAAMAGVLRTDRGATGLVTANGGFLTKHALGLYSAQPGRLPFRRIRVGAADVPHRARQLAAQPQAPVRVEACTVLHDRDGPVRALLAALCGDGRRAWGFSTDPALMTAAMTRELAGAAARIDPAGRLELS
jgi:acetyl-CoA C-acetyltransferase